MRMKPLHMVSTALFVIAFIVSIIGPYIKVDVQPFMWIWTALLIIVGWIVHIIGIIKK